MTVSRLPGDNVIDLMAWLEARTGYDATTGLTADDRAAIDAQVAHDIYRASRRAHRRYLGQLPIPRPSRAAYRLLERVEERTGR